MLVHGSIEVEGLLHQAVHVVKLLALLQDLTALRSQLSALLIHGSLHCLHALADGLGAQRLPVVRVQLRLVGCYHAPAHQHAE